MRPLDYARGWCGEKQPRRDERYTPVYEPGPIWQSLIAAWDVLAYSLFLPLFWIGHLVALAGRAALAWLH